ncbi:MAG: PQQ-binding-like beta-propeller repeat protein [Thermoguttaceae bacterium]|nr:PQQ-binding-like beta-propeller repeat protein [Thermoguttaceae bacterium]
MKCLKPLLVLCVVCFVIGFFAAVWFWLQGVGSRVYALRTPSEGDVRGETVLTPREGGLSAPELTTGTGVAATQLPGEWLCFRGEARDNIAHASETLTHNWSEAGNRPHVLWSVPLGEGHAGAAVWAGRVYLIDYDESQSADAVRCLSLADGSEIWCWRYPQHIANNHGRTRTVPAIATLSAAPSKMSPANGANGTDRADDAEGSDGGNTKSDEDGKNSTTESETRVVTLDPKGVLFCHNAITGELRWSCNLVERFQTVVPGWYVGQCPLIDADRVIVAPGGPDASFAALSLVDGSELWRSANPSKFPMSHSSIVPMTSHPGAEVADSATVDANAANMSEDKVTPRKMYVWCGEGGVLAVDAGTGALLWETSLWKVGTATVASPLQISERELFFSGGYKSGAMLLRLTGANLPDGSAADSVTPEEVYRLKFRDFEAEQHTPIFYRGYVYGERKQDPQFVCLDPRTGKKCWESGRANRIGNGYGPFMLIDDVFYLLDDKTGELVMVSATPEKYIELGRCEVIPDCVNAWGPMALAGNRLILRDERRLFCVELH